MEVLIFHFEVYSIWLYTTNDPKRPLAGLIKFKTSHVQLKVVVYLRRFLLLGPISLQKICETQ